MASRTSLYLTDEAASRLKEAQAFIGKMGGNSSVSGIIAKMLEIGIPILKKHLARSARAAAQQHKRDARQLEKTASQLTRRSKRRASRE